MESEKLNITEKYVQEFNEKCANFHAPEFLRFITETDGNNVSYLDLIVQLENVIKLSPYKQEKKINLSTEEMTAIIEEFYSKYFPKKAQEVKQILNGTHPYFIDTNGNSTVHFEKAKPDEKRSSNVGHSGNNPYLNFNVYLKDTIEDLRTTAHELSHAISAHEMKIVDAIKEKAPKKVFDRLTRDKSFSSDCICEIESHIIEKLFNKFLLSKGIMNEEDIKVYENSEKISLVSEITLIREERDILKRLTFPITQESLTALVKKLYKDKNFRLIDRIKKMHDTSRNSEHMFRYVVGRVVADVWFKKYRECKTNKERREMLESFQKYLNKTHKLNLESACEELLGLDFTSIVEDYYLGKISDIKTQNI